MRRLTSISAETRKDYTCRLFLIDNTPRDGNVPSGIGENARRRPIMRDLKAPHLQLNLIVSSRLCGLRGIYEGNGAVSRVHGGNDRTPSPVLGSVFVPLHTRFGTFERTKHPAIAKGDFSSRAASIVRVRRQ